MNIYMNIKGQGHSLIFKIFFSLETAKPIEANFHVDPKWDGGTNVCSNGSDHMTKMAAMPLYGIKKIKLLWNQTAYYLENLYAALGTRVLPSMFK